MVLRKGRRVFMKRMKEVFSLAQKKGKVLRKKMKGMVREHKQDLLVKKEEWEIEKKMFEQQLNAQNDIAKLSRRRSVDMQQELAIARAQWEVEAEERRELHRASLKKKEAELAKKEHDLKDAKEETLEKLSQASKKHFVVKKDLMKKLKGEHTRHSSGTKKLLVLTKKKFIAVREKGRSKQKRLQVKMSEMVQKMRVKTKKRMILLAKANTGLETRLKKRARKYTRGMEIMTLGLEEKHAEEIQEMTEESTKRSVEHGKKLWHEVKKYTAMKLRLRKQRAKELQRAGTEHEAALEDARNSSSITSLRRDWEARLTHTKEATEKKKVKLQLAQWKIKDLSTSFALKRKELKRVTHSSHDQEVASLAKEVISLKSVRDKMMKDVRKAVRGQKNVIKLA